MFWERDDIDLQKLIPLDYINTKLYQWWLIMSATKRKDAFEWLSFEWFLKTSKRKFTKESNTSLIIDDSIEINEFNKSKNEFHT